VTCQAPSVSCATVDSGSSHQASESVLTTTSPKAVSCPALDTRLISAPYALVPNTAPRSAPLSRESVVTSLSVANFKYLLEVHGLLTHYPTLLSRITHGFPIALNLPPLTHTFIPHNHYRSKEDEAIVQEKVDKEVAAGRISGPFTIKQAHAFFGGHFRTCPLSLVPKPVPVGISWRMVENFSFEDEDGRSVNSLINSDDFPTSWITAQEFGDWVSLSHLCCRNFLFLYIFSSQISFASRLHVERLVINRVQRHSLTS
jgi:hypothetical protein